MTPKYDPSERVLKVMKANYSADGRQFRMKWTDGYFAGQGEVTPVQARLADTEAEEAFLSGLRSLTRSGRVASDKPGRNSAPCLIASLDPSGKFGKNVLEAAMLRLFATGRIKVVEDGSRGRRRSKIVEVEQPEVGISAAASAPATFFEDVPAGWLARQVAELLLQNASQSDTAHAVARQLCARVPGLRQRGASEVKRMLETAFSATGVASGFEAADGSIWQVRFRRVAKGGGMEDRIVLEA